VRYNICQIKEGIVQKNHVKESYIKKKIAWFLWVFYPLAGNKLRIILFYYPSIH